MEKVVLDFDNIENWSNLEWMQYLLDIDDYLECDCGRAVLIAPLMR